MKNFTKIMLAALIIVTTAMSFIGCSNNKEVKKDSTDNSALGIKTISTKDLKAKLGNKDWIVVDTRINDAFNGWKLDGVARGGHIKGATDFSANWLKVSDKQKESVLEKALKTKTILGDKNIVLYDANGKDANTVAKYLKQKGINNIYTYDVKQWAADNSLPMESYANYQMLVPASFVNDLINGKKPETYTNDKYKIFEVAWGEASKDADYVKGHIKGAVHINTDEIESPPLWSINSDVNLQKFAEKNGLTPDTTIVLYGPDPMASYRIAAIAKYIGVKDVRVLNGGSAAFKDAGYETETISNEKKPVSSFGAKVPVNKGYIVDITKAKEVLADKANSKLVDVRSWDEYTGKVSGYSDLKFMGRPAGSTWGHAGSDPNHLQDYRNIDNTMRNKDEILAMWKQQGITPDQRLTFFCGSGWRAAEVLTYADVMGLKNISLYSNGWYEWSSSPKNPVETGTPKIK